MCLITEKSESTLRCITETELKLPLILVLNLLLYWWDGDRSYRFSPSSEWTLMDTIWEILARLHVLYRKNSCLTFLFLAKFVASASNVEACVWRKVGFFFTRLVKNITIFLILNRIDWLSALYRDNFPTPDKDVGQGVNHQATITSPIVRFYWAPMRSIKLCLADSSEFGTCGKSRLVINSSMLGLASTASCQWSSKGWSTEDRDLNWEILFNIPLTRPARSRPRMCPNGSQKRKSTEGFLKHSYLGSHRVQD